MGLFHRAVTRGFSGGRRKTRDLRVWLKVTIRAWLGFIPGTWKFAAPGFGFYFQ